MNKLKEEISNLEVVKRIRELESFIDLNDTLKIKLNNLKDIQKKMVNAKEYNQINQYKVYKDEYDKLYSEILDFPFVEEYLELLDEANNMLLNISYIIEKRINKELE